MAQHPRPSCPFCITKCTQVPSVVMGYTDASALNCHISCLRGEMTVSSATLRRLDLKVDLMESRIITTRSWDTTCSPARSSPQGGRGAGAASAAPEAVDSPRISGGLYLEESRRYSTVNTDTSEAGEENARDRQASAVEKENGRTSDSSCDSKWHLQLQQQIKPLQRLQQHWCSAVNHNRDRGNGQCRRRPPWSARDLMRALLPLVPSVTCVFVTHLAPGVDGGALRAHLEEMAGAETTIECELQPSVFLPTGRTKLSLK